METTKTKRNVIALIKPIMRKTKKVRALAVRKVVIGDMNGVSMADVARMDMDALRVIVPRISTPTITADEFSGLDAEDITLIKVIVGSCFVSKKALADSGAQVKGVEHV